MSSRTNTLQTSHYRQRFAKVFKYIEQYLDQPLSVEKLAEVAHFSKYHFHRQFSAMTGLTVYQYLQLQRLKKAGYQLSFRRHLKVIDIAAQAGFENAESFSRSFKKVFGQTPSQFSQAPDWDNWQATYDKIHQHKSDTMTDFKLSDVRLIEFPATKVAALEHHGSPMTVMDSVRTFIAWRKQHKLSPTTCQTYNIFYQDSDAVSPEQFRMDICVTTTMAIPENPQGIVAKTIKAGRCAVYRLIGGDHLLQSAVMWLYGTWLEQSTERLRDAPLFVHRVSLFRDVPEHQMVCDIYLPIQ